jgi:hypothetical protein
MNPIVLLGLMWLWQRQSQISDFGVQRLLEFWDGLNARRSEMSAAAKASFPSDYAQAKTILPTSSSRDGSGGFAKWMEIANQYAKDVKVPLFRLTEDR